MQLNIPHQPITFRAIAAILLTGALCGCKLDISNPNAAPQESVLNSIAGIRGLAIGMQGRLGNAMEENIYVPALVSGEFGNTSATQSTTREFQNFPQGANSAIDPTNVDLLDIWVKNYAVVKTAHDILDNIDPLGFPAGTRAGIVGLAKLYKAMAFGTLIEAFEKIPVETTATPQFADRQTVLAAILSLLASAKTDVTGATLTADFNTSVLAPNFDLLNTIRAMQARYSLAAGNNDAALNFANEVPATASAVITFAGVDINPFRNLMHSARFFGAISTFRTNAEPGDTRVNKFTTSSTTGFAPLSGAAMFETNIFLTDAEAIPVFTRDELSLIRAEALARLNRLPEAIAHINIVRSGAGLAPKADSDLPTQTAVLDEVYVQRTYSLFSTGLHWADERRFGKLTVAGAKVRYLPYPFSVRATNPNTPANP